LPTGLTMTLGVLAGSMPAVRIQAVSIQAGSIPAAAPKPANPQAGQTTPARES
jgi:hypothetical protein